MLVFASKARSCNKYQPSWATWLGTVRGGKKEMMQLCGVRKYQPQLLIVKYVAGMEAVNKAPRGPPPGGRVHYSGRFWILQFVCVLQFAIETHEDYLNGLQSSTSVMFQGTAPPLSALTVQHKIGVEWQKMKEDDPASLKQPLRTVLFQTWASDLKSRILALETDNAHRQEAVRLNILTEPVNFRYVRWSPERRALVDEPSVAPLTCKLQGGSSGTSRSKL
ncbi:unnamed protein product [Symbiodinium microadriaticum]|nr:unnamed protein product [Symbiodinium microadriaticum]CAE7942346.1 unnamed protein product [Symbiodinium sp. KB8]